MKTQSIKRIMIFGRPGSGKSTFSHWLAQTTHLPLHHLDKHFFIENWVRRNYIEFLQMQEDMVDNEAWVIDGNCTGSLETRWSKANLVLYFNFPKIICYFRVLKRFFKPNLSFDDRAAGCYETVRLSLLKYMWSFEKRVTEKIIMLKEKYPDVIFQEIKNDSQLSKLKHELNSHLSYKCILGHL